MLFGSFNINICDINAILVTHEHIDHVKSIATLSNKYNIPVYATSKTWNSMPLIYSKLSEDNIKKLANKKVMSPDLSSFDQGSLIVDGINHLRNLSFCSVRSLFT